MNPIVVIGAGGSGKWIATDVKLAAIDLHNRRLLREHGESARQRADWNQLPPEIRVLAVDVASAEQHPVVRRDAQHREFSLDYSASSQEFVDISSEPGTAIEAISSGRGEDFPRISAWLSKRDAECYDIRRLPTINSHGAGQLRQLGRLSLFSAMQKQNLPEQIRSVLQDVNQAKANNSKVTVFVCGSLAGGTGSGVLWDVAALARLQAQEVLGDQYDLVGCIVLPGAFRRIARAGGEEKARMAANAYAGLRELERLMNSENHAEFAYSQHLTLNLNEPIFSTAYLIEGSRPGGYDLAGDEPWYGTYPTIADTILLHAATRVDMTQIIAQMALHPQGPFSVTGAVQWVLPVEDIIHEAGHLLSQLSLESLVWGRQASADAPPQASLAEAGDAAASERDRFLRKNAEGSSALVRFTDSFLVQQRAVALTTALMYQQLRFNDQQLDPPLPTLVLAEQIELGGRMRRVDPLAVLQQVEQAVARSLGGRTDALPEKRSVHAVLNHYRQSHEESFTGYLRTAVAAVLNSTRTKSGLSVRPGGLLRAEAFLDAVRDRLESFHRQFSEVYDTQQRTEGNITRLERARQEQSHAEQALREGKGSGLGARNRQAEYLRLSQRVYDLTMQDLIHAYVLDIIDSWNSAVGALREQVNGWVNTLRDSVAGLRTELQDIRVRRLESSRIRSRRYVTTSGDDYETRLINAQLKAADPADQTRSAAVDRILQPMSWTWESEKLLLTVPVQGSRQVGTRDWREVLPEHTGRCFATFAGIREVTIWEALQAVGYDQDTLREELVSRLKPITDLDSNEQLRVPYIQLVEKNIVLADWQVPGAGAGHDAPAGLSHGVRGQLHNDAVRWDDPHLILGVGQLHLVKMSALARISELEQAYEPILTGRQSVEGTMRRLPLHLFPGEALAAEIELGANRTLGRSIKVPNEIIGLLQHEQEMTNFSLAVGFELLKLHTDRLGVDTRHWRTGPIPADDESEVHLTLGSNAYAACQRFVRPETLSDRRAVQWANEELTKKIQSIDTNAEYARQLRVMARKALIPEFDNLSADLRDGLDCVLRALILRRAAALTQ